MITNIKVERFRGIHSATVDGLKTVNVFVGKNNCGKTALLEAVFFWACTGRPDAALVVNSQRFLATGAHDQLRALFYQYNTGQPFSIALSYNGLYLKIKAESYFQTEKNIALPSSNKVPEMRTADTARRLDGIQVCQTDDQNTDTLRYRLICQPDDQSVFVQQHHEVQPDQSPVVQYLSVHNRDSDSALIAKIIGDNRETELVDVLKAFSPDIQNIKIGGEKKTLLIDDGRTHSLPLALQGDGVVKAASILAATIAQKDSVVLIDEVDNGIHANALKPFWQALVAAAKKNNSQIFATTHSWESLECLKAVLDDNEELQDSVSVFHLVRRAKDNIFVYPYAYPSFKNVIESEVDIR